MLAKVPTTSHNYLKITIQKTLLKSFFMSIYITAQLGVEKGLDAKRDDLTTSKGQYPKLMEG